MLSAAVAGGGFPPPEDDRLWRRFDATDPAHFDTIVVDEGTGVKHLKGGALRFDDDGCSVFSGGVLESLGLTPDSIRTPLHSALASATRREVEAFSTAYATEPGARAFEVLAAPLQPAPEYAPAHALIRHLLDYASNTKRRRAEGDLARQVFVFRAGT